MKFKIEHDPTLHIDLAGPDLICLQNILLAAEPGGNRDLNACCDQLLHELKAAVGGAKT